MVYVSGGVFRDDMPWGSVSCGSCNPKLYSHSAGSLRIRFFLGSTLLLLPLPDIVAAGDVAVVDDANACDCVVVVDDDDEAVVSVSATRVDSEHCVVRTLRVVVVVVVVNENNVVAAGANADPRDDDDDDESNTTSSKADTEKWVIVLLLLLLLLDLPRNLSNSNYLNLCRY